MADVLEGKIAKILDDHHVIINLGAQHGVREGMQFVVFTPGDDIVDPDTGESLGAWEMVKGFVAASHVQDTLTICVATGPPGTPKETPKDPTTNTLSAALIREHMPTGAGERLDVNQAQVSGIPQVRPVSIGDKVRSVSQPE